MPAAEAILEDTEMDADWECPICAKNPTPNAETIAAIEETLDIISGKISAKRYHSLEDMFDFLHSELDQDA